MTTLDSLLAHLVEHPEDAAATWQVLADWLEEHDDPRWELIRLRHDGAYRPELTPAQREGRVQALLAGGMLPCVPRLVNSIGMEFAWIPAGTFVMGSPPEEEERSEDEKQHEVAITRPFYLGVHPVTQGEYEQVMKSNPSYFRKGGGGKKQVKGLDTKRFPVESVSWEDAGKFCAALNTIATQKGENCLYRLPTEAEWEYACRSGSPIYHVFHHGDKLSTKEANFNGDHPYGGADKGEFPQRPVPVDDPKYRPHAFGLHQMHGNVWEWCSDWYGDYPSGKITDPQGPEKGSFRVVRGGSWSYDAGFCRAAGRSGSTPGFRNGLLGFRLARVPSGQDRKVEGQPGA